MEKVDMSKTCGLGQMQKWIDRYEKTISDQEFEEWYEKNCAKCIYESEICMYGEQ